MAQPVLVIHGVGNRGKGDQFAQKVAKLAEGYKDQLQLIDVYWGDLAAEPGFIEATLPSVDDAADVGLGLGLLGSEEVRSSEIDRAETVADAAAGAEVRDGAGPDPSEVRSAILEEWSGLTWLNQVDDDEILREAGKLVGELVAEATTAESTAPQGAETHEVRAPEEVRGVRDIVGKVLHSADKFLAKVIGRAGGNLNRSLRKTLGPGLAGFFGDVISYLRKDTEIYQLIRDRIEEEAPGAGTAERPIGAIAHSLGGVILFDMAVAKENPLHIKNFLTFGSQAPFFHAISDRSDNDLAPFEGVPVTVPPSLSGNWINLWEPLDPVAFIAAKVFKLSQDPIEPDDRMAAYVRESGFWTHSRYWDLPEFPKAISDAFLDGSA